MMKTLTIPDLLRIRIATKLRHPKNARVPLRVIKFRHFGLIALDSGHIAHQIRRFRGGGTNRFSPTTGATYYSEHFVPVPSGHVQEFAGVT
jgi:hypothetical protein